MSKQKSLAKNSIYYLIYNVLNILFPFLIGIYVARILTPDSIGAVAFAQLNKLRRKISISGLSNYLKSKHLLKNILKFPYYCLTRCFNIKKQLQKVDILAQKYSYDESEHVGCVAWELDCYPKKLLDSAILHKFEGDSFPIPVGYHDMLEIMYSNYMELPPKSQQVGHHYYRIFKK